MKNFADCITSAMAAKKSCVVVGLDPRLGSLPQKLRDHALASRSDAAQAILEFNQRVIEAVAPYAVAVKPQAAFYEALGWEGLRVYGETIRAAQAHGLLVIADVKRGDIGSTAEAYAEAHLDIFGADAVTVNPYLGTDSITPFLKRTPHGKGLFVLVKTSNASSIELQDLEIAGDKVYERVAALAGRWGKDCIGESGYSSVGAVVGATFPAAAARLRKLMPQTIFLVPGYGAQGASANDCRPCFGTDGYGAIVNSSRGIIFAFKSSSAHWEDDVAKAAKQMREELEQVRIRPT